MTVESGVSLQIKEFLRIGVLFVRKEKKILSGEKVTLYAFRIWGFCFAQQRHQALNEKHPGVNRRGLRHLDGAGVVHLRSEASRQRMAQGIAEGIAQYVRTYY